MGGWVGGWIDVTVRYAYKLAIPIPVDCYATLVRIRVLCLVEILIHAEERLNILL